MTARPMRPRSACVFILFNHFLCSVFDDFKDGGRLDNSFRIDVESAHGPREIVNFHQFGGDLLMGRFGDGRSRSFVTMNDELDDIMAVELVAGYISAVFFMKSFFKRIGGFCRGNVPASFKKFWG